LWLAGTPAKIARAMKAETRKPSAGPKGDVAGADGGDRGHGFTVLEAVTRRASTRRTCGDASTSSGTRGGISHRRALTTCPSCGPAAHPSGPHRSGAKQPSAVVMSVGEGLHRHRHREAGSGRGGSTQTHPLRLSPETGEGAPPLPWRSDPEWRHAAGVLVVQTPPAEAPPGGPAAAPSPPSWPACWWARLVDLRSRRSAAPQPSEHQTHAAFETPDRGRGGSRRRARG
jgi:hypothetical protein